MSLPTGRISSENNKKGEKTMITNGFTYIAVLACIAGGLIWAQHTTKAKFFDYVPPWFCCT